MPRKPVPPPVSPPPMRLASIRQAAERYSVDPVTIRRRIAAGQLKAYKIRGSSNRTPTIRVDLLEADRVMLEVLDRGGSAATA